VRPPVWIILVLHAELSSVRALLVKGLYHSNLPSTLELVFARSETTCKTPISHRHRCTHTPGHNTLPQVSHCFLHPLLHMTVHSSAFHRVSEKVVERFHLEVEDCQLRHSCSTVSCAQAALVARAVVHHDPGIVLFVPGANVTGPLRTARESSCRRTSTMTLIGVDLGSNGLGCAPGAFFFADELAPA
jgi:hypothetical protein